MTIRIPAKREFCCPGRLDLYFAKPAGQGKGLSRETIKYAAAAAMLLDHIAVIFLKDDTLLFFVFRMIGGMTAVTMCFFLAEGFRKTNDLRRYQQRMLVSAVFAQVPYMLAFSGDIGGGGRPAPLNMLFNLFFCLCFLECYAINRSKAYSPFLICLLLCGSCLCDWGILAPGFVFLFYKGAEAMEWGRLQNVWIWAVGLSIVSGIAGVLQGIRPVMAFLALPGQLLAMMMIRYGYSGKRRTGHLLFHKWFFYVWYGLHLLMLYIYAILR